MEKLICVKFLWRYKRKRAQSAATVESSVSHKLPPLLVNNQSSTVQAKLAKLVELRKQRQLLEQQLNGRRGAASLGSSAQRLSRLAAPRAMKPDPISPEDRELARLTKLNTLQNSSYNVRFEMANEHEVRSGQFSIINFFLKALPSFNQLCESHNVHTASQIRWHAPLATTPVHHRTSKSILRRRENGHAFPFSNDIRSEVIVVHPRTESGRRGSSVVVPAEEVRNLLAKNTQ